MVEKILGKPGGGAGQRGKVKGFEQRKGHCLQDQLSRQGDFLPTTTQSSSSTSLMKSSFWMFIVDTHADVVSYEDTSNITRPDCSGLV